MKTLVCTECQQRIHGMEPGAVCPLCSGETAPARRKRQTVFNRSEFSRRKRWCHKCDKFGVWQRSGEFMEGCKELIQPCKVELLWRSPKVDWCPIGRMPKPSNMHSVVVEFPPEDITPMKELAIVVFAIGDDCRELAEHVLPRMNEYADLCNAELVVIEDDQLPEWPIGNKLRFGAIASHYERALLLDLDVWVNDHAPDIFKEHGSGVWMHNDWPYLSDLSRKFLSDELKRISAEQDMPIPQSLVKNTGVLLLDRKHAEQWKLPKEPLSITHTAEQAWIDIMLSTQTSVSALKSEWNWLWFADKFRDKMLDVNIVHLCNAPHPKRMELLAALGCRIT